MGFVCFLNLQEAPSFSLFWLSCQYFCFIEVTAVQLASALRGTKIRGKVGHEYILPHGEAEGALHRLFPK